MESMTSQVPITELFYIVSPTQEAPAKLEIGSSCSVKLFYYPLSYVYP